MVNEMRDALFKWRMLYCYCAPDYFWMTFYSASLKAVIETVDEIQLGDSLLLERINGSTFFMFEIFVRWGLIKCSQSQENTFEISSLLLLKGGAGC
jgi:hypothetical protein